MDDGRRFDLVTLGETLAAFVATTPGPISEATVFERHIAGAEANVAVGLARAGLSVAYIGRVGDDGFGTAIVRALRGEGVDVTHLAVEAETRTGVMFRERRVLGAMDVVYHRAGSAGSLLTVADIERASTDGLLREARWVHLTGITPALSPSARAATERARELAREAGATVSLDINLRRRLWSEAEAAPVLRALAAGVDVVLGSVDELAVVAGTDPGRDPASLVADVVELGPSTVVAKLGADGAVGFEARGRPVHAPAFEVPLVVDPVGAGDAFCVGFIAGRLGGADLATALRMGNACGALAVVASGDQAGLPDRAELDRFLAGGPDTLR